MIKLSEDSISKAETSWKIDLLCQTVNQVVNAEEKLLKEIKSSTPVNTQIIRKWNSLMADMEKVLVVWIEDQTSHDISLSWSLIQSKALSLFILWSLREIRKMERTSLKLAEVCSWGLNEKPYKTKVQGEAASTDIEAAASYLDVIKIINGGGYTKWQIFKVGRTALDWEKMLAICNFHM